MLSTTGGGKILAFLSTLPDIGPGSVKKREALVDTIHEKLLMKSQNTFYQNLGEVCSKHAIAVDLFIGAKDYMDITSIGAITKTTGGQVFYYPTFCAAHHQEQLYRELYRNLSRESVHNALCRLRCGRGIVIKKRIWCIYKSK
jgi:protein transport protein SEC24